MLKKWENRILFTSVFKLILLHLVCLPLSSFVLENCCYKNPLCTSLCLVYQIAIMQVDCNSILASFYLLYKHFQISTTQQFQIFKFFLLLSFHKMCHKISWNHYFILWHNFSNKLYLKLKLSQNVNNKHLSRKLAFFQWKRNSERFRWLLT